MRIAVFVSGESWGNVTPNALAKGLGGRETAAVMLGMEWARSGHEVTVFAATREVWHRTWPAPFGTAGRISFVSLELAHGMLAAYPFDVILSWEEPGIFSMPELDPTTLKVCGMQVAHVHDDPELLALPDVWVALSEWHRRFLTPQLPPGQRIEVFPNCVDHDRYGAVRAERPAAVIDEHAPRFFYASSPDRGLVHVLDAWPELRRRYPGCTLGVVYGARGWAERVQWSHGIEGEDALRILDGLEQDGVTDHGKVGQDVLARLHAESDILLYPCDTFVPTETGCITVIEACAAGSIPVITDCDCLGEEFNAYMPCVPMPYDEARYLAEVDDVVRNPAVQERWRARGAELVAQRSWREVSGFWLDLFATECIERGSPSFAQDEAEEAVV